jgi:hypothetical protein
MIDNERIVLPTDFRIFLAISDFTTKYLLCITKHNLYGQRTTQS